MSHSSSSSEIPLTTTIPTDGQVPYTAPSIPILFSLSTYLVLLALPTLLSNAYPLPISSPKKSGDHQESPSGSAPERPPQSYTLNAALTLLLPLLLGALFGPSITSNSIFSTSTQRTLMDIGYIGLLLLIFEAGVSLDAGSLRLMRNNAGLSTLAALTGVLVPIALSMGLGMGAYGYTGLQAFASGAALCSTSLGTTLALLASSSGTTPSEKGKSDMKGESRSLKVDLKRTRVGCVLVCAALLDDIIGLVIAGIIPGLAQSEPGGSAQVRWPVVVRPILVSVAFGLGTPVAAMGLRWLIRSSWKDVWGMMPRMLIPRRRRHFSGSRQTASLTQRPSGTAPRPQMLLMLMILTLMGFVAGSFYAGTSELFGAYLAGAFIGHVFEEEAGPSAVSGIPDTLKEGAASEPDAGVNRGNPAHSTFVAYLQPILTHLLVPLFFASIGAALPIKAMFTTHPDAVQIDFTGSDNITVAEIDNGKTSHQVIWRGLVYAMLMVLGKMVVGIWMLIWPDPKPKSRRATRENNGRQKNRLLNDIASAQWFTNVKSALSLPSQKREDLPRTISPEQHVDETAHEIAPSNDPSQIRSALLLGLAMVARGEIALIIAQLARPLLIGRTAGSSTTSMEGTTITTTPIPDEEPFAVVIWAILVSTVGGALGVGVLVASWEKRDREEAVRGGVHLGKRSCSPSVKIMQDEDKATCNNNVT